MHQFDLNNRTAIITGGAQGFGLDIAKRFLKSGAKAIIWDIDENELDVPFIAPNPERLRPALLTPWGTTDDEPPIGESRFGKNRVTFSQRWVSLGDLGCSKCNGGTIPSGSGCTTCRRKLGWVPADATKKHWVPTGLIADDDKHW